MARAIPRLEISALGTLDLVFASKALAPPRRSVRRLLIYVVFNPGRHSRSHLARLLFPGYPEVRARTKLRQTLFHLSAIGARYGSPLAVTREWVEKRNDFPLSSDYEAFMQGSLESVSNCTQRVALYRGPFLAEETDDTRSDWDQWAMDQRKIVDDRLGASYDYLIQHAVSLMNFDQALCWAEEWMQKQPLADAAHLAAMQLLVRGGRGNEASHLFSVYQERCITQYGVKPGQSLQAFNDDLDLAAINVTSNGRRRCNRHNASDNARWRFVTLMTMGIDADHDQISDLKIEQHVDQCLELARKVAQTCGGSVSVAADGVIELRFGWDAPLEDGPRRALHAAFELRRLLGLLGHAPRMGIHCGRVMICHDQSPIGSLLQIVRLAAWTNTQGAGVVLTGPAFELLSYPSSPMTEVVSLPPMRVFGAEMPIFWLSTPAEHTVAPLTEESRRWSFIGRDTECLVIQQVAQVVMTKKQGQLIWVTGQAGIGKTRLLQHIADHLPPDIRVVRYACTPNYQHSLLHPIAAIIRETLNLRALSPTAAKVAIQQLLQAIGEEEPLLLTLWFVWLGLEPDDSITCLLQDYKALLYESVLQVFTSQLFPMDQALLVEDLHWADPATLEWFQDYLLTLHKRPVLMLVTTRDLKPALQKLAIHETILALAPWNAETSRRFLRNLPHWTANAHTEASIIARGCGIPFYLDSLAQQALSGRHATGLPDGIQSILEFSIAKADFALDMVQIAAVIGDTVTLPDLQALLIGRISENLARDAAQLVTQGLWVVTRNGGWSYRHELLREAVYAGIPQERCRRLHWNIAQWLEKSGSHDPAVLAHHFEQGGEPHAAARYLLLAGRRALRLSLYNVVAAHFARAIELFSDSPDDPDMVSAQAGLFLILRLQQRHSTATKNALVALEQSCHRQGHNSWHLLAARYARWFAENVSNGALAGLRKARLMAETTYDPLVDPQLVEALGHYALGVSHYWLGHLDTAKEHLQHAVDRWREEWAEILFLTTGDRYREFALAFLAFIDAMQNRNASGWTRLTTALDDFPERKYMNMQAMVYVLQMSMGYWTDAPEATWRADQEMHTKKIYIFGLWKMVPDALAAWAEARLGRKSPQWAIVVMRKSLMAFKLARDFGGSSVYLALLDISIRSHQKNTLGILFAAKRLARQLNIYVHVPEIKRLAAMKSGHPTLRRSRRRPHSSHSSHIASNTASSTGPRNNSRKPKVRMPPSTQKSTSRNGIRTALEITSGRIRLSIQLTTSAPHRASPTPAQISL